MKQRILKISLLFLLFSFSSAGCKKDKDQLSYEQMVGDTIEVFELQYNEPKHISYNGFEMEFKIQDIIDSVTVDCSKADFSDNNEGPLSIRISALLKINEENNIIEVTSKPCGALSYNHDGQDIKDVKNRILNIESAPANLNNRTYYTNTFISSFGEGSLIGNKPFRIFMAKAFPAKYDHPNATINDYKFVFILTKIY